MSGFYILYLSLLLLHLSFCSVCSFCSFFSLSLSTEICNPLSFLNCEHRLEFYSLSIRKRRSSVTAPILDKKAFGSSRIYFTRGFSPETPLKTSIIRAYVFDALTFSFCFLFFFFALLFASLFWEKREKATFTREHPKKKKKKKKKGRRPTRDSLSLSLKTRSFSEYEFEAHYKLARDIAPVSLLNFCFFRALLIRTRRA